MKELDICSSNAEVVFNNLLCSTRNPVECASGRLKTRSSMLTQKIDLKLGHIPKDIYACLALHSFCEYYNTFVDEDLIKLQIGIAKRNNDKIDNTPDPVYSGNIVVGEVVTRILIEFIKNSSSDHLVISNIKYSITFKHSR